MTPDNIATAAYHEIVEILTTLTVDQRSQLVAAGHHDREACEDIICDTLDLEAVLLTSQRHPRPDVQDQVRLRERLRSGAAAAPTDLDLDDLDDDALDDVDGYCHVIDRTAFALTEYARHGQHGRTARYLVLIRAWATVFGDPCSGSS